MDAIKVLDLAKKKVILNAWKNNSKKTRGKIVNIKKKRDLKITN